MQICSLHLPISLRAVEDLSPSLPSFPFPPPGGQDQSSKQQRGLEMNRGDCWRKQTESANGYERREENGGQRDPLLYEKGACLYWHVASSLHASVMFTSFPLQHQRLRQCDPGRHKEKSLRQSNLLPSMASAANLAHKSFF